MKKRIVAYGVLPDGNLCSFAGYGFSDGVTWAISTIIESEGMTKGEVRDIARAGRIIPPPERYGKPMVPNQGYVEYWNSTDGTIIIFLRHR